VPEGAPPARVCLKLMPEFDNLETEIQGRLALGGGGGREASPLPDADVAVAGSWGTHVVGELRVHAPQPLELPWIALTAAQRRLVAAGVGGEDRAAAVRGVHAARRALTDAEQRLRLEAAGDGAGSRTATARSSTSGLQVDVLARTHWAYVMPAAERSLFHALSSERFAGQSVAVVQAVAEDVAAAVGFLHSKKLVHLDLKPRNVVRVAVRSALGALHDDYRLIDLDASAEVGAALGTGGDALELAGDEGAADEAGPVNKLVRQALAAVAAPGGAAGATRVGAYWPPEMARFLHQLVEHVGAAGGGISGVDTDLQEAVATAIAELEAARKELEEAAIALQKAHQSGKEHIVRKASTKVTQAQTKVVDCNEELAALRLNRGEARPAFGVDAS